MMSRESAVKVLKGAGLAGGAAALVYLIQAAPGVDLGQWTPVVVAVLSVLLNVIRKMIEEMLKKGGDQP